MKIITLTDEQFDTLFEYVDNKVTTIVDASVDYQDSQILEDFEDFIDVHTILENTKEEYERKLQDSTGKTTKGRVVTMNFNVTDIVFDFDDDEANTICNSDLDTFFIASESVRREVVEEIILAYGRQMMKMT